MVKIIIGGMRINMIITLQPRIIILIIITLLHHHNLMVIIIFSHPHLYNIFLAFFIIYYIIRFVFIYYYLHLQRRIVLTWSPEYWSKMKNLPVKASYPQMSRKISRKDWRGNQWFPLKSSLLKQHILGVPCW